MNQVLVWLGTAALLSAWVFGWGALATGSARQGVKYVGIWLLTLLVCVALAGLGMLIAWPFMPD